MLLVIVAISALLLSAFALARPAAATHSSGFDHQPLPIDTSTFDHDAGECDDTDLADGQVLLHFVATQQNTTDAIRLDLTFAAGGSASVESTNWNEPGRINANVTHHFFLTLDGDVMITDLVLSTGEGNVRLSHVCRADEATEGPGEVEDEAGILIEKVDEQDEPLAGAIFTVEGVEGQFTTAADGRVCVDGLPEDTTLTVTEIQAPAGYAIADPASRQVETDDDGCDRSPEVTFVNVLAEGEQPSETVRVSIMKHLCDDVSTVEEFEAIEAAGAAAYPGNPLAPLAFTVVACPTIVLTGDVPTAGAVSGGDLDFDFSVIDADGTQLLSTDGVFAQAALCEDDVEVDANGNGDIDADVCLDTSHYHVEVTDGIIVISETDVPNGSSGFGTLRFTPGSDDETALTTSLASVEATGEIRLDTAAASEQALADGTLMLHVYNFAAADQMPSEGEQPSTGEGTLPSQAGSGEDTLPDTATWPIAGSIPAALLALVMLTGLAAAGTAMRAEARRRR